MCLQESLAYWILPIFLRWLLDVIYWKFLNKLSHCTPAHTTWSVFFKYLSFEKWQSYKTLCLKNRKGTVSGQSFYARHKWFYLFSFYLILLLLSSPTPMDPFVIHTKILARRSHHQTAFTSLPHADDYTILLYICSCSSTSLSLDIYSFFFHQPQYLPLRFINTTTLIHAGFICLSLSTTCYHSNPWSPLLLSPLPHHHTSHLAALF